MENGVFFFYCSLQRKTGVGLRGMPGQESYVSSDRSKEQSSNPTILKRSLHLSNV